MLKSSKTCFVCGKNVERSDRVIHHCHLTGAIFGIAHSKCKLRVRTPNFLPIFFQYLSRYDAHHIIKNLKLKPSQNFTAISKTDETFISFSINVPVGTYKKKCGKDVKLVHSFRFFDSYQFVFQSLESLARTLSQTDFKHLKDGFSGIPDDLFGKITRKCFIPCRYLDSFAKFQKLLPDFGES